MNEGEPAFLRCGEFGAQVGNHRVVAGEHAGASLHAIRSATAYIGNVNAFGGFGISMVFYADDGALEAQPNRSAGFVEFRVVKRSRHHIVHGLPGRDCRNHFAHQQTCDGCVSVGKVVDVGLIVLLVAREACGLPAGQVRIVESGDGGGGPDPRRDVSGACQGAVVRSGKVTSY